LGACELGKIDDREWMEEKRLQMVVGSTTNKVPNDCTEALIIKSSEFGT